MKICYSLGASEVYAGVSTSNGWGALLRVWNPDISNCESSSGSKSWGGTLSPAGSSGRFISFTVTVKAGASGYVASDYGYSYASASLTAEWPDVVTVSAGQGGRVSPSGRLEVWSDYLSVKATPDPGCVFKNWQVSGGVSIVDGSANGRFRVTGDGSIKALFDCDWWPPPPNCTLTIKVSPSGSGTTSPAPGTYSMRCGTRKTVRAIPNSGWKFDHWSYDGRNIGSSNPVTVTVDGANTLIAYFVKNDTQPPPPPPPPPGSGYKISIKAQDEDGNPLRVAIKYSFDNSYWRSRYTPLTLKKTSKFRIWLKAPQNVTVDGVNYTFVQWRVTGRGPTSSTNIDVYVNRPKTAIAVYRATSQPPPPPPSQQTTYIRIDNVTVEVWPARWDSKQRFGRQGKLILYDHFVAIVRVQASSYNKTGGPGGLVPAQLSLSGRSGEWFTQRRWTGSEAVQVGFNARSNATISAPGTYTYVFPLASDETFRAERPGTWNFSVDYSWSNTDVNASGVASTPVLVVGLEGPAPPGGGAASAGANTTVLWLPISQEQGYIVVLYRWPDGNFIADRDWVTAQAQLPQGSAMLQGGLWSSVEALLPGQLYTNLEELLGFAPPGNATVSYGLVGVGMLEGSELEETATISGFLAYREFPIREVSLKIVELHWDGQVSGVLRVLDWSSLSELAHGWVFLVLNASGSVTEQVVESGQPFSITVPSEYELYGVAAAPGVDVAYSNVKYGRQLLVKQPP